jgi:hypothetical protein
MLSNFEKPQIIAFTRDMQAPKRESYLHFGLGFETGAEMGFVEMHFDLVGPATDFAVFNVFLLQTRGDIDFHHIFATTVGAIKLS